MGKATYIQTSEDCTVFSLAGIVRELRNGVPCLHREECEAEAVMVIENLTQDYSEPEKLALSKFLQK